MKKLAKQLTAFGYPVAALQGNLSQTARERVMAGFRSGETPILIATNVAARGLDIEHLGQVINYELPETAEWLATLMREPRLDPASKVDNIRLSARLLRFLLDKAGTPKRALAAYYQGIGSVLRDGVSDGGARYARIITSRQAWFS